MTKKKLMLLGGSHYLMPAIEAECYLSMVLRDALSTRKYGFNKNATWP